MRESAGSSTCRDSLLYLDKYLEHNCRGPVDLGKGRIRDAETVNTRTRGMTLANDGQHDRTFEKEKGWVAFESLKSFCVASASSCSSCTTCSAVN